MIIPLYVFCAEEFFYLCHLGRKSEVVLIFFSGKTVEKIANFIVKKEQFIFKKFYIL